MVLRGSRTKPDDNLRDIKQKLDEAEANIRIIREMALSNEKHIEDYMAEIFSSEETTLPELKKAMKLMYTQLQELETLVVDLQGKKEDYSNQYAKFFKQLACGGMAGGIARSSVAPVDRVKILLQTYHLTKGGEAPGMVEMFKLVYKNEGLQQFWRGNGVNCIRVFPYAGIQFASYDSYKEIISNNCEHYGVFQRLLTGALAGATAASVTHPLDVMRVRLAVQSELKGFKDCFRSIIAADGIRGLYKGYTPTIMSLAPFIAINFSTFDYLKTTFKPEDGTPIPMTLTLGLGAAAGLTAQTFCYPLDTVRRRMQIKGVHYTSF